MRTPEWLAAVAGIPITAPRSVVLLGSPIYLCPTEPGFSMIDARYPADGHLLATQQESVFGTADRKGRLARTLVSWCYFSDNVWANELHHRVTERFYGLFVQEQAGTLVAFTPDHGRAFETALAGAAVPVAAWKIDPEDSKLTMRTAQPRQIPVWLRSVTPESDTPAIFPPSASVPAATQVTPAAPAAEPLTVPDPVPTPVVPVVEASLPEPGPTPISPIPAPPAVTPPPAPPVVITPEPVSPVQAATLAPELTQMPTPSAPGRIGIGIAWTAPGVDLDLYVRPRAGARELYYRRTSTPEGTYFHDYRDRILGTEYEYVELAPGADLRQVSAWVNFYKGRGRDIVGKVCLRSDGRTLVSEFRMTADHGNRGFDSTLRSSSAFWVELCIIDLLAQANGPTTASR